MTKIEKNREKNRQRIAKNEKNGGKTKENIKTGKTRGEGANFS